MCEYSASEAKCCVPGGNTVPTGWSYCMQRSTSTPLPHHIQWMQESVMKVMTCIYGTKNENRKKKKERNSRAGLPSL